MKKLVLCLTLAMGVGICSCGNTTVHLHGSMKDLGKDQVEMKYDGAAGKIANEWSQLIPVNKDGTFDYTFELKEPGYFTIGRNTLYLSPGDDMEVNIGNDQAKSWFKGKGAEANTYMKGRLFPKGGSFLKSGSNVKGDFEQTRKVVEELALQREQELNAVKNVSKEFKELEMIRIKADIAMSYLAYVTYAGLLRESKSRAEADATTAKYYESIKAYMDPLLKTIAAKDKYLDVAVARDVLLNCCSADASMFDFPRSERLRELDEAYVEGMRLSEKMTKPLYEELYAFGSKLKNKDFKQAFLGRLARQSKLMESRPAIDFTVIDPTGKEGKLSDYKGKVLFVDFWATWCVPCLGEMPVFKELSRKYTNIRFVSISIDDKRNLWLNKLKQDSDHANVVELLSNDPLLRSEWDITAIPRYLLIDKDFNIISAAAPRPSETKDIIPLLDQYNK